MIAKFTPHPEAEIGRQAIDDWRTGHIDRVKPLLSPQLAAMADQLGAGSTTLPSSTPISVRVVRASTASGKTVFGADGSDSAKRYDISYEYAFEGRWMLADVVFLERGSHREIVGMHARMEDHSVEQGSAFSLRDKSVVHYLVFLLVCISPLICLTAFVLCLRTPMRRHKVWWSLFTLLGFVSLHFNWTTGEAGLQPISFLFLGAAAVSAPYGPWVLSVAIPIGAIWFLARRKQLTVPRNGPTDPAAPSR
ncbi:MAG TPA: hypothetical protein VM621_07865 [Luteibacter sp.]|uniref:hypothetical protein n=1 Tax=Luteibacter sp. TaxID=1886636 RepID=UPI002CEE0F57|nr:hypothetical protein [Luteibacter sp.]HVI54954.1 hypothetical protein [Luteibacter sp.]